MEKLGFGLMRLPQTDPNTPSSVDIKAFKGMSDTFIAAGGTYFDTAYPYHGGSSETAFREAVVKRYPRDAYTVTDKLSMFLINQKEEIPRIFEEQLARCGVEYFDYYWLHSLGKISCEKSEELQAFAYIAQKKAEGKIRHIGVSSHTPQAALAAVESGLVEVLMFSVNPCYDHQPPDEDMEKLWVADSYSGGLTQYGPGTGTALRDLPAPRRGNHRDEGVRRRRSVQRDAFSRGQGAHSKPVHPLRAHPPCGCLCDVGRAQH